MRPPAPLPLPVFRLPLRDYVAAADDLIQLGRRLPMEIRPAVAGRCFSGLNAIGLGFWARHPGLGNGAGQTPTRRR